MRNKIVNGIVTLAVTLLISGASVLALASQPGTQADPAVTLSYLNNVFRPQVMASVQETEQEMVSRFNARIAELEAQLQSGQPGQHQGSLNPADTFAVVTLRNGQSLTSSVGTEIMLRIGTAQGFGSAPALVNYTTGSPLSPGSALTANNMYLVTIEGNGIRATAETVRVLVRGSYTIT